MPDALLELPVVALDIQASRALPGGGWPFELAWLPCTAAEPASPANLRSQLLQPPEGETFPPPVARITGLTDEALRGGLSPGLAWELLAAELARRPAWLVVHYARFERPFLETGLEACLAFPSSSASPSSASPSSASPSSPSPSSPPSSSFFSSLPSPSKNALRPLPVLDTHAIARRLVPDLPSRSLRALAGFLDLPMGELRRAGEHALATAAVWRALVARLAARRGILTLEELLAYLTRPAPRPARRKETPLARGRRLGLPSGPGVYHLLGRDGRVLYVGKARSLRARVNQHFRSLRGRGARGLELLSQVWDVRLIPCDSEAEALALEASEILHHDPPYNVAGRKKPLSAGGLRAT